MNLDVIVTQLRNEAARLTNAINALEGTSRPARSRSVGSTNRSRDTKPKGGLTAEGRKKLSIAMKKRWAARRKAGKAKA
jgi:hypothetical protein